MFVSEVGKGDEEDEDDQANGQRHLRPKCLSGGGGLFLMLTTMMIDDAFGENDY